MLCSLPVAVVELGIVVLVVPVVEHPVRRVVRVQVVVVLVLIVREVQQVLLRTVLLQLVVH